LLHQYSNLIENANAIIFSVDSRHYITDWNRESVSVTQYEKGDVFTKKIEQFVHQEQQQSFSDVVENVINGIAVSNFELQLRKKDGVHITVLLNATARLSASGAVVGVLFVGQDVTELWEYRKSLEEQIEDRTKELRKALEKEKELVDLRNRFVSMASHEFRMPLSTINSSVNFVRNNEALREEDVEKLRIIEAQINHMRSMIDDVLTIGKVEASKLKATRHNVDLVSFLRNIITEVKAQHMERSVILNTPTENIWLQSDEKLLRNIFINLLTNAIKFSPTTTPVEVEIDQTQTHVKIRIIDQGIGIKPEDIEKVFTPFNRGSNTGTIKGTGLGLSIVKRATETLGGSVHADSTVSVGTTMTVALPLWNIEPYKA
jgi:PAS domain S-box-containing protein